MTIVLHGQVQPRGVAAIERLLGDDVIRSAVYFSEAESTNTVALDEIRQGIVAADPFPRLYLADQQTAGRGRHGRTWLSDTDSLTFSLVMQRNAASGPGNGSPAPSLWPLAVGVAIARSIEFCFAPVRTQLKWPNDVYLDGSKVAGILLETTHGTPETVVIGIGVNTNTIPESSQASALVAQSIAAVVGRQIDRHALLATMIEQVIDTTQQAAMVPKEIVDDYRCRCLLSGKTVSYDERGNQQTATCRGIDDTGELLLETSSGVKACNTGEVNLVRVS